MPNLVNPQPSNSAARWLNTSLVPVKQHFLCCGVTKGLVNAGILGATAAEAMESIPAQLAAVFVVTPVVTYGVMRAENWWHQRRHARHTEAACAHPPLTLRRYFRETAYTMGFCALTTFGVNALWPHDHDHHEAPPAPVETPASTSKNLTAHNFHI